MNRLIIIFLSCYISCAFSMSIDSWKSLLRSSIRDNNECEFFQKNKKNLPEGIIVIHSWNASPQKDDDSTVGHISLQIGNRYISVWPEDSEDPRSPVRLSSLPEDFEILGSSQYLVLQLPEDEYQAVYQETENIMMNFMENQDEYAFTIGAFELKTPHGDPKNNEYMTVSSNLSAGSSSFNIMNKAGLQHIIDAAKEQFAKKLNNKKFIGRVAGGCSGFAVGAVSCGVIEGFGGTIGALLGATAGITLGPIAIAVAAGGVALSGVATVAGHFIASGVTHVEHQNFEYPTENGHKPFEVCYKLPSFNEEVDHGKKAACCKTSVYNVLKQSSELTKHIDDVDQKECSVTADLYMNLYGSVLELKEALEKSNNPDQTIADFIEERGSVRTRNSKSDIVLDKITSCLGKSKHQDVKNIIKKALVNLIASKSGDFEKFEDILSDLELNKGKLAILLANPSILPGSSLQNLGASLSHSKSYITSSFENDLGSTVTSQIQIRKLSTQKYLGLKKVNGDIKVVVDYKENLDCYEFRMIQVTSSHRYYALYNDTFGLTLQPDGQGWLSVCDPEFSDSESFLIVKNSEDSRSFMPLHSCGHSFSDQEWFIESFE